MSEIKNTQYIDFSACVGRRNAVSCPASLRGGIPVVVRDGTVLSASDVRAGAK